jgi:hypothetical protein
MEFDERIRLAEQSIVKVGEQLRWVEPFATKIDDRLRSVEQSDVKLELTLKHLLANRSLCGRSVRIAWLHQLLGPCPTHLSGRAHQQP